MPTIRVKVEGIEELRRALDQMAPGKNRNIFRNAFVEAALKIQRDAADRQIAAGGGGEGNALPPLRSMLTSRTGTLRRSIKVDRGPLPFAIEIGTDLGYGAVHEFGGKVKVRASRVREHTRRVLFGRRVEEFVVPAHTRRGHSALYPRRPFLEPARRYIAPEIPEIFIRHWRQAAGL